MEPLVLGIGKRELRRVVFIGALFGLTLTIVFLVVGIAGPVGLTSRTVLLALVFGLLVGAVLPAAVGLASLARIEFVDGNVKQMVAGMTVAIRPAPTVVAVEFRMGAIPVTVRFRDGGAFRASGIPLSQIRDARARVREFAPNASVSA